MATVSPPAPPAGPTRRARPRIDALDGLRGVAILLVVLSHGWQLWPTEWLDSQELLRPVFRSGNFAVTIFLVAAGYLTYLAFAGRGTAMMHPGVALVRRVLRVGPSLWLMLATLAVVSAIDTSDQASTYDNSTSFAHVLTYTWNWYVQENLVSSRPDFGHLWYLSVDMQAFVVVAVIIYLLRRRPRAQVAALTGLFVVLTWWRFHVSDTEFVFQVLVRTTARMDPFLVGVLLAAALPRLRAMRPDPLSLRLSAAASALALVPLMWFCADDGRFLGWGVTLLELDVAVLIGAVALGARTPAPFRSGALTMLGRNSLLLYIWHYPVFVLVNRHSESWAWPVRTAVALVLVLLVCLAAHWTVERRSARFMRHPGWSRFDHGLLPGLRALLGRADRVDAAGVEGQPDRGELRAGGDVRR